MIPAQFLKHAYIPDIYGKERRKRQPGKEGKLGVEGMPPAVLEDVLRRAGATFLEGDSLSKHSGPTLTKGGPLHRRPGRGAGERRGSGSAS